MTLFVPLRFFLIISHFYEHACAFDDVQFHLCYCFYLNKSVSYAGKEATTGEKTGCYC
jgi:hypothetical protein